MYHHSLPSFRPCVYAAYFSSLSSPSCGAPLLSSRTSSSPLLGFLTARNRHPRIVLSTRGEILYATKNHVSETAGYRERKVAWREPVLGPSQKMVALGYHEDVSNRWLIGHYICCVQVDGDTWPLFWPSPSPPLSTHPYHHHHSSPASSECFETSVRLLQVPGSARRVPIGTFCRMGRSNAGM